MKIPKIATVALIVIALAAVQANAGDEGFWETLLNKINRLASHKGSDKTYTSVMGVRGAETDKGSDSLYWKGEKSKAQAAGESGDIPENELEDFKAAVSLAAAGQNDQALEAFKGFLSKHPKSVLAKDANEAIAMLEGGRKASDQKEATSQQGAAGQSAATGQTQ